MKRVTSIIVAVMLCISFFCSSGLRSVYGEEYYDILYVWNSDTPTISTWTNSYFNISAVRMDVGPSFYTYFMQGILNSASEWSSVVGSYPIVTAYESDTATFKVFGGTVSELQTTVYFSSYTFLPGVYGTTKVLTEPSYFCDYGYYNGSSYSTKYGYHMGSVVVAVVNRTGASENRIKCTCLHEIGHALGWDGHSTGDSDVMTSSPTDLTSLTNRDKAHLSQVY